MRRIRSQLTDVVKSNGTGNINLFKDLTAQQLEQLRLDNEGTIILAIDVNEDASGTEKSSSQGVSLKSLTMTIIYSDDTQADYDLDGGCCFTETQALLAEAPGDVSTTLLHHAWGTPVPTGSRRTTSFKTNSTAPSRSMCRSVFMTPQPVSRQYRQSSNIELLQTNDSLGDPEAFYDYSNGFEDLAILSAVDAAFLDDYAAGRDEAPTVILTNPPEVVDPLAVVNWNYFPSATSYYLVGYEDLYPGVGDYDFNDLSVAYNVKFGLNNDNQVVTIQGAAYLLTRGAGYTHNWRLKIEIPATAQRHAPMQDFP